MDKCKWITKVTIILNNGITSEYSIYSEHQYTKDEMEDSRQHLLKRFQRYLECPQDPNASCIFLKGAVIACSQMAAMEIQYEVDHSEALAAVAKAQREAEVKWFKFTDRSVQWTHGYNDRMFLPKQPNPYREAYERMEWARGWAQADLDKGIKGK